jgi:hypothetical protein
MTVNYEFERRIAIESVLNACRLCRTVQSTFGSRGVIGKKDGSPVTIADFGAQALISNHLMMNFPEDPLVAEENAQLLRQKKNARLLRRSIEGLERVTQRDDFGSWIPSMAPRVSCVKINTLLPWPWWTGVGSFSAS